MSDKNTTSNLDKQIQVGGQKILEGHTKFVNSVIVKDNLIISGSGDKTIKIWDITSGLCLKTIECHRNIVMSVLAASDNLIISGSYDKTIKITPMSLFPGELPVFQQAMDNYNLAPHLEREILDYSCEVKSVQITLI